MIGNGTHSEECKARFRDEIQKAEMAESAAPAARAAPVAAGPAPGAAGGAAAEAAPARHRLIGKSAPPADARMHALDAYVTGR